MDNLSSRHVRHLSSTFLISLTMPWYRETDSVDSVKLPVFLEQWMVEEHLFVAILCNKFVKLVLSYSRIFFIQIDEVQYSLHAPCGLDYVPNTKHTRFVYAHQWNVFHSLCCVTFPSPPNSCSASPTHRPHLVWRADSTTGYECSATFFQPDVPTYRSRADFLPARCSPYFVWTLDHQPLPPI